MADKGTICMVSDVVSHYVGGFLKSALRFSEKFTKDGYRVIFLAGRAKGDPEVETYKGVKIYRFRSIIMPRTKKKVSIALPEKKGILDILKKEKVRLVHLQTTFYLSHLTLKAAKELGIPVIVTSHAQPENWVYNGPVIVRGKFVIKGIYKMLIKMYNSADLVICVSKFGERILKKEGLKTKTVVISNGVNLKRFKKQKTASFDKKYSIDHSKYKYVSFVGRLMAEKKVGVLVRAMPYVLKKMPNARLLIVGEGFLEGKLKKLSKKLGIADRVIFTGRVSEEDLPLAFSTSDVFVLPSLVELQGMVVLEAMASGKPVIIADSKISASPELVEGNGFLFIPNNSEDLSKKIIKILQDSRLRRRMGERSLAIAKRHDITKMAKRHELVYKHYITKLQKVKDNS